MRLVLSTLALLGMLGRPGSAHADSPTLSADPPGCLQAASAQISGCDWSGTITFTRTVTDTKVTTLPPTINNHGGSQTVALDEHDRTTVQVNAGQGTATRDHTLVNTITRHEEPGAQCAPTRPLTFGTHDSVQEQRDTQRGSAQLPVRVSVSNDGTYTGTFSIPNPSSTSQTIFKETWGICGAPKPRDSDQTFTRPASDAFGYGFSGSLDPDNPNVLDGSHTDDLSPGSSLTVTWHLTSRCADCDSLKRELAEQSLKLMEDSLAVRFELDQFASQALGAQAESPELVPAIGDLQQAQARFDAQFDNTGVLGDSSTAEEQAAGQAYADAVLGWYDSSGAAYVAMFASVAPLPQPSGLPRSFTLSAVPLALNLQTALNQLRGDRQQVRVTQTLVDTCQDSGGG